MQKIQSGQAPLVFGEVLFDHFPGEAPVLGGAPLNVAAHLAAFGAGPAIISRVGQDAEGHRLRAWCRRWGLDSGGIQDDPERPTGQVRVSLADGQPRYEILPDQAYDAIDPELALLAAARSDPALLYHGSLAARGGSRRALEALRARLEIPVWVDVNLRPPWTPADTVLALVEGVDWIKLNAQELGVLVGGGAVPGAEDLPAAAGRLAERTGAGRVLVTLGEAGALLSGAGGEILRVPSPELPAAALVDTVGAGDALSAVALLGLLAGWDERTLLERGVAFAAAVCTLRGALPADPAFYRRFSWIGAPAP